CCYKRCASQLTTDAAVTKIVGERGEHQHDALTDRQREVCVVAAACKRTATEALDSRPRRILRREIKGQSHILKPDVTQIMKRMYRAKRKCLPALPKTQEEAVRRLADDLKIETSRGEKFGFTMEENKIIIFTCDTNLRCVNIYPYPDCSLNETWFADGTFEYAPDKFAQLYSVHGHTQGHNVRLAFACLPDKKTSTYVAFFDKLKALASERVERNLQPAHILVDFEDAALSALRQTLPGANIRACRFHFTQNCIKRIRANNSMLTRYRCTDSETGKWLRDFNGLPCLPPDLVPDAFAELMSCAPETSGVLHIFADSILNTYIETTRCPSSLWARAPSMNDPTTTNAAESFHSSYNKDHISSHPNIHITIQSLLDHQEETYLTERTIRAGINDAEDMSYSHNLQIFNPVPPNRCFEPCTDRNNTYTDK
ncbi:Protein FAR1-RELATED SEQUENCE 5, partial [Frankliniella fusca]